MILLYPGRVHLDDLARLDLVADVVEPYHYPQIVPVQLIPRPSRI